jgi:hypothetical protein
MAFGGDVSFSPAATLDIEIGGAAPGTQYDRVAVADSVALAGAIEIALVNGFVPTPGQQFTVMTYGSRTGEFGAVRSPTAPGLSWTASYGPTSLTLTVGGLAGDMNSDGSVDALDLSLFARHFGTQSQATVQQGDFNGDGRTSLADLVILRNNFSGGLPIAQVAQPVPVPEPAMVALVGLVLSIGLFQVHFRAAAMASSPRLPS